MSTASTPDAAAAAALLAPGGRLRAAINLGNPILASTDPASGRARGVSVDLARTLAERLGVPLDTLEFPAAMRSVDAVTSGAADIGFFAIDPLRGAEIAFTDAYVLIEGAYLVRTDSRCRANEDVDRAGTRVAVGKGSAYDLFLTRELKAASFVRVPGAAEVVQALRDGGAEVAGGIRQVLEQVAAQDAGLRLLPGRFMVIRQAMGLARTRGPAAEAALRAFVEDMKASGFVAEAMARHAVAGASVAPPSH
ncbi:MAG: transporter substrate-binding domain-containing protein [Burkholderiales bacterium]|nr:transporter substrate-binding domain-containing protein [Burkholderiales bacterium]